MDNNSKKINSLVAAAILGLSNIAVAEDCQKTFTPIENLQPEDREMLIRRLEILKDHVQIDWKTVVIGVDENGKLIIKARKPDENNPVGNPSCWTK
jgi:hypothetical protein